MHTKTLYMETTQVASSKSAAEITQVLVAAGARQIAADYSQAGDITGLRWMMIVQGVPVLFQMPTRTDPIYQILRKRRKGYFSNSDQAKLQLQAERVAWRQLLRWVQAQAAMIATGMVEAGEVFAPYIVSLDGKTLWQELTETRFKAIAAPTEPRNQSQ